MDQEGGRQDLEQAFKEMGVRSPEEQEYEERWKRFAQRERRNRSQSRGGNERERGSGGGSAGGVEGPTTKGPAPRAFI